MRAGWRCSTALGALIFLLGSVSAFAQADLSLTFVGGPNGGGCGGGGGGCGGIIPIAPGTQVLYELILNNNGPAAASGAIATVTLPAKTSIHDPGGLAFLGCSSVIAAGIDTLTCTQANLAPGGTFAIAFTIDLDTDYPWQDGLAATASVTSSTPDPVSSNNSVTDHLLVNAPPTVPTLDPLALALLFAALGFVGIMARK